MNVDRNLIDGGDACTFDLDAAGLGKITMQLVTDGTISNLVLLILQ